MFKRILESWAFNTSMRHEIFDKLQAERKPEDRRAYVASDMKRARKLLKKALSALDVIRDNQDMLIGKVEETRDFMKALLEMPEDECNEVLDKAIDMTGKIDFTPKKGV